MQILAGLAALAVAKLASAHGGGMHYVIDGQIHTGNWDWLNNTDGSIQRYWTWYDHTVSQLYEPELACGFPGLLKPGNYHAAHTAGSVISINYTTERYRVDDEDNRYWTFGHSHGPMLAYMAKCPDEGCESVDIHSAIWFKIFEAGLIDGTWTEGYWAMRDVYRGANLDVKTPSSLKAGKYLLRHEMINLEPGGAQFFPNCIQLDVSSEGDSLPDESELLAFPGAYDKDDPYSFSTQTGSEWFYTEHGDDTFYPLPGGPVWEG